MITYFFTINQYGGSGKYTNLQAINNLLPTQSGNAGKALFTDGSLLYWDTASGGGGVTTVTATLPLLSSGGLTPDISLPVSTSIQDGYLSYTDWISFDGKQNALGGSGVVQSTAGIISYISGTSSQFIKGDGSLDSTTYLSSVPTLNQVLGAGATSAISIVISSGSAISTLSTGGLSVTNGSSTSYIYPNQLVLKGSTYQGALLTATLYSNQIWTFPNNTGTVALTSDILTTVLTGYISGAGTVSSSDSILSAIQKLNGNISGITVGTWGALNYPSWTTGTPFVKMTAAGTFSLDTNTYLTSVGSGGTNQLTYWNTGTTIGALDTSTYPSLTEVSYVKGVTSGVQTQLNAKQATLISATNIKTINGSSILGSGDLTVSTTQTGAFGVTIDGGGSVITTGSKGYVTVPYNGTITNWYLAADQTGSIVIDIKRLGTSIVGAGNLPTLSSQQTANAAASSWTSLTVSVGDVINFNVNSASTLTTCNLVIKITKS